MGGLEGNKLLAGVLVAALVAMVSGIAADSLISSGETEDVRAYQIAELAPAATSGAQDDAGPEPITPLLASADLAAGQKVSKKCVSCHSFNEDGAHKVWPNLWNIVNASVAKKEGYPYSKALAGMSEAWTYENLNLFLLKPKSYISGTKMGFSGLKEDADRANLIAWMRTLSNNPAPLN